MAKSRWRHDDKSDQMIQFNPHSCYVQIRINIHNYHLFILLFLKAY